MSRRNLPPSSILQILGPDLFAPFTAVRVPGRVIWCNYELAREFGFDVPSSNQMSLGLHEELTGAFSYRSLLAGEDPAGRSTITLFADRYGGDGVAPALGSARSGFFPYCDAFGKGVGYTPLFRHDDPEDFCHSHGGLDMDDALSEALFGELNVNLFSGKTTRVLVVIDQDDVTVNPNHTTTPRALAIRVGDQLRPAHILATRCWTRRSRLDVFLSMVRETGQLVVRDGQPDLQATFQRIIDDHAWTAARQVRWRLTHCFLSASNMRMDGGMLDHNTLRSNPRLPPIRPDRSFDPDTSIYGDYIDRTLRITTLYRTVLACLPEDERRRLRESPLRIGKAMDAAYLKRLEHELLCAAGLKASLALRVQSELPEVAGRFADILTRMTGAVNRAKFHANRKTISDAAVLDVFGLLARYPGIHFGDPGGTHARLVWEFLQPIFKGNRFHIARKRAAVEALVPEFISAYRELMTVCRRFAAEFYGDEVHMKDSIVARAAFENRPIEPLYKRPFTKGLIRSCLEFRTRGDLRIVRSATDDRVASCLRNTEELLRRGDRRPLRGGGLESQIQTIDGIRYAIRSGNGESPSSFLHVSVPVECEGADYLTAVDRFPRLSETELAGLRFRFTTDAWATEGEAAATLEPMTSSGLHIAFPGIRSSGLIGELQGFFHLNGEDIGPLRDRECIRGYVFAIPDCVDLAELARGASQPENRLTPLGRGASKAR